MITKNILYKYFKDFADNHLQIKDYGYGDLWEISSSQATTYPLFWVSPQPSSISGNEITYNFNILIGDRLEDGDGNKVEVESDTFQIGLDLLATLNINRDVDLDKNNTLTPFIHDFKDRIAGHLITLSVTADFDYNECAVPTTGTPTPPTSSCPVAIITINGVAYGSASSGGTEDIAVVDGNGTPVGSLVSGNWVVTSTCSDATAVLKNSAGTTLSTTNIASGASANITAPDSTITINSASFLTNPSGVNPNILVKDGTGSQVGSKVGSEWIVPTGGGSYNVGSVDRFGNTLPTIIVNSNTTLNWKSYDYADFFLTQMDTTPTTAEQTYIHYIVDQYESAGLWEKMLVIFPLIGNTANNNSLNLRYPFKTKDAFQGYFLGSPTHNANGITTSATSAMYCHASQYHYENNDWHINIYSRTNSNPNVSGVTDMAFAEGNRAMEILSTATRSMARGDGINSLFTPTHTSEGSFTLNCLSGANGVNFYKNGSTLLTQFTNGSQGARNGFLMIGAHPQIDVQWSVALFRPTSRNYSLATYGSALTAQQIIDKYTIDQAAQTILSRQV